ncbi:MAG: hypothetical protein IJX47_08765 [Clostridia bacterium]|nr:hypothetical protein [Clostridia bacterium]
MRQDAFSNYHPAVNFLFFVGAIVSCVMIQHPAYLLAGVIASGIYYLLLNGRSGWKTIGALVPLFLFLTVINPLFNTSGVTVLFRVFGRPYTLEALLYGVCVASIFVVMMLWMGCYNKVLTGDKFTCLFGNLIPSVSLLLVMVFRMVPNLIRKTGQIGGARRAIGKGAGGASLKQKLTAGVTILGTLTAWTLEGSVMTGDSMRARGYGTAKRRSFTVYRMTAADWGMLTVLLGLLGTVVGFAIGGSMTATFVPQRSIAPVSGINLLGFAAYCIYLLIPTVLHIQEAIWWNISRYRI